MDSSIVRKSSNVSVIGETVQSPLIYLRGNGDAIAVHEKLLKSRCAKKPGNSEAFVDVISSVTNFISTEIKFYFRINDEFATFMVVDLPSILSEELVLPFS